MATGGGATTSEIALKVSSQKNASPTFSHGEGK